MEWRAQMGLFKKDVHLAKSGAKIECQRTLDVLQERYDEVKSRLSQLQSANDDTWGIFKMRAEKFWIQAKAAYLGGTSKLK